MLIIHGVFRVMAAERETFLSAVRKLVKASRAEAGVLSYGFYEDVTEPNTFISAEVFEDESAMDRQGTSRCFSEQFPIVTRTLADAPEVTLFTVSDRRELEL